MSTSSPVKVRDDHVGNGILTTYAWTFIVKHSDEIEVYEEDKTPTLRTIVTHYTLVINANGTGTVTFVTAPTDTKKIALILKRRKDQTTAYKNQSTWKGLNFENSYDKLTQLYAQLDDRLNFTLRFDLWHTDVGSNLIIVGDAATRANKVLGFDASGLAVITQDIGTFRGDWATATAYVGRDLIKDTSNDNIYICITPHTSTGAQPISGNADVAKWELVLDLATVAADAAAAAASAAAALVSENNAAADAVSTANDAIATAADAASTANDAIATAADAVSTAADAAAAAASAAGMRWKDKVVTSTTGDISLTGEQTIDGILTSADRVLVKNQTAPAENGIYLSGAGAWSRTADADSWLEMPSLAVAVEQGTADGDKLYICTSDEGGTLETTAITFVQFGAGGINALLDDTSPQLAGALDTNNQAINTSRATVASHATTSAIWAALGNEINFTGTETLTDLPAAPLAGSYRVLHCAAACVFTHNANIFVPGDANFTAEAGDIVVVHAITTTTFRLAIIKKDGKPIASGLQVYSGSLTRDLSVASATVQYTGIPFPPKAIIFLGSVGGNSTQLGLGVDDGTNGSGVYSSHSIVADSWGDSGAGTIFLRESATDHNKAVISDLGATTFDLDWTKSGSPTGTATVRFLAIG